MSHCENILTVLSIVLMGMMVMVPPEPQYRTWHTIPCNVTRVELVVRIYDVPDAITIDLEPSKLRYRPIHFSFHAGDHDIIAYTALPRVYHIQLDPTIAQAVLQVDSALGWSHTVDMSSDIRHGVRLNMQSC